jgi:hypothetical protein
MEKQLEDLMDYLVQLMVPMCWLDNESVQQSEHHLEQKLDILEL